MVEWISHNLSVAHLEVQRALFYCGKAQPHTDPHTSTVVTADLSDLSVCLLPWKTSRSSVKCHWFHIKSFADGFARFFTDFVNVSSGGVLCFICYKLSALVSEDQSKNSYSEVIETVGSSVITTGKTWRLSYYRVHSVLIGQCFSLLLK